MEGLEITCEANPRDIATFFIDESRVNVELFCYDLTRIVLTQKSAKQLHEWLGRYLENSNG